MKNNQLVLPLLCLLTWFCFGAPITAQARTTPPRVVVTLKPIHSLVTSIMEGVATPFLLLPDGASPHTFALKPSLLKQMQMADLIIWVGPSLESFMIKPLAGLHPTFGILSLLHTPHLTLYPLRQARQWSSTTDHAHPAHATGEADPHIWLSVDNAILMAEFIAYTLSQVDSKHAKQYQANVKQLVIRLKNLKDKLTLLLKEDQTKPFLVYHDGYQYFEKEFGLSGAGTMLLNPHAPLSAHGLKKIQEIIHQEQIQCIFYETEFQNTRLKHILAQWNVIAAELDPLGTYFPPGKGNYESTLLTIGKTLHSCFMQPAP